MTTSEWINPKYADLVKAYDALPNKPGDNTMANCANCNGTGRIIYIDKGKTKDIPCGACQGSGQAPE